MPQGGEKQAWGEGESKGEGEGAGEDAAGTDAGDGIEGAVAVAAGGEGASSLRERLARIDPPRVTRDVIQLQTVAVGAHTCTGAAACM